MAEWVPLDRAETERTLAELSKQGDAAGVAKTQKAMDALKGMNADVEYAQKNGTSLMGNREFTEARQASATNEPAFKSLQRATIPTIAGLAGLVPGLGMPAQALLGAGATKLNQALGLEPSDNMEVVKAGAIPLVIGGAVRGVKALAKGGAELIAPGALKEAGAEAMAERLGSKASSADRVVTADSVSKSLYRAAQSTKGVPTRDLAEAADIAFQTEKGMSTANPTALRLIKNLRDKFETNASLDYEDVMNEAQRLRLAAKGFEEKQPQISKALNELREQMLTKMDRISPVIREANAEYRRYIATQDVIEAVRAGNPGVKIRKLFEENPKMISAFGLKDKKDVNEVYALADAISDVASSAPAGIGRQLLSAVTEPIGQALSTPTGRYFMRQLIKPTGKLTPATLSTLAQFTRAFTAQEASQRGQ